MLRKEDEYICTRKHVGTRGLVRVANSCSVWLPVQPLMATRDDPYDGTWKNLRSLIRFLDVSDSNLPSVFRNSIVLK